MRRWVDGHVPRAGVKGSMSKWRPVTRNVPQGSVLGEIVFNILINYADNEIRCTLNKFVEKMKCWICLREGMLSRGTLGSWRSGTMCTTMSSPRLNASSCILIRTISNISVDWGMSENKPEEKNLGLLVDKKWDVHQQCVCLPSTKPTVSRSVSKKVLPTGQERWLSPFSLL